MYIKQIYATLFIRIKLIQSNRYQLKSMKNYYINIFYLKMI